MFFFHIENLVYFIKVEYTISFEIGAAQGYARARWCDTCIVTLLQLRFSAGRAARMHFTREFEITSTREKEITLVAVFCLARSGKLVREFILFAFNVPLTTYLAI